MKKKREEKKGGIVLWRVTRFFTRLPSRTVPTHPRVDDDLSLELTWDAFCGGGEGKRSHIGQMKSLLICR